MIEPVGVLRSTRIVRALALGLCSALLWAACGAGSGGGIEGKYYYQMEKPAGEGMTLELRKDGIAVGTRPGGRVQEGTYRAEGDKVTVSLKGDGANLVYTLEDDGNLTTVFYGSERAVFVKQ